MCGEDKLFKTLTSAFNCEVSCTVEREITFTAMFSPVLWICPLQTSAKLPFPMRRSSIYTPTCFFVEAIIREKAGGSRKFVEKGWKKAFFFFQVFEVVDVVEIQGEERDTFSRGELVGVKK